MALFLTEALDVERLHGCRASVARLIAVRVFIGEREPTVRSGDRYCGHVTGRICCCNYWSCAFLPVEIRVFAAGLCVVGAAGVGGWKGEVWHGAWIRDRFDGDQTGAGEH